MKTSGIVFEGKRYWSPYGSTAPADGLPDVSRYGNDGTFGAGEAAPSWVQLPSGLFVLEFGGNDYVEVANDTSYLGLSALTVIIWAYYDIPDSKEGLFNCDGAFFLTLKDGATGNERFYITTTGATVDCQATSAPSSEGWHFLGGVYDGTNGYLYRDMTLVDSDAGNGNMSIPANKLFIGSYSGGDTPSNYFNGKLLPPIICHFAMSYDKLNKIYQATKGWFEE